MVGDHMGSPVAVYFLLFFALFCSFFCIQRPFFLLCGAWCCSPPYRQLPHELSPSSHPARWSASSPAHVYRPLSHPVMRHTACMHTLLLLTCTAAGKQPASSQARAAAAVYIHTYIHNIHTYIHTYTHTYIHTYILHTHTHTHTYIHAYMHTCIPHPSIAQASLTPRVSMSSVSVTCNYV